MKTATELFNKHFRGTDYEGQFEEALAEHDAEIIELIDEMIKDEPDVNAITALTELKNKLEEK